MSKPRSLYPSRKEEENILDKELRISVKSLLFILFTCILFFIFAFMAKGPTYGVL